MRIIYMGTAPFAVPCLDWLIASRHELAAVYTQPPRPAKRNKKHQMTPVHAFAGERGMDVQTPESLRDEHVQEHLRSYDADLVLVAAYGLLLPKTVLDIPQRGCVNIHGSLLPRWRGAAPVERAIEAGDRETGISLFQMEEGLDTGPCYVMEGLAIDEDATALTMRSRLSALARSMLARFLDDLEADKITATAQSQEGVTYAPKIDKAEYAIDWSQPADLLERRIRAFYPMAWTMIQGERVRVLSAELVNGIGGQGGSVLDDRLTVACSENALRLKELQRAGRKPLESEVFLRGFPVKEGQTLG